MSFGHELTQGGGLAPEGRANSQGRGEGGSAALPRRYAWVAVVAAWTLVSSCTTYYQPLSGLHRPVAIDTDYANFAGTRISLHCLPGPVLGEEEARDLCRKLARLFDNQGGHTDRQTGLGRRSDADEEVAEAEGAADAGSVADAAAKPRALRIQLGARLIHEDKRWLLPWVTKEYTFAQDVVIRDETGFLLIRETLTGRLVRSFGFFGHAEEELSRDFYGQLSQLAFNAKLRRRVLGEAHPQPAPAE